MSNKKNCVPESIVIDGTEFVPKEAQQPPITGSRHVVVVDRGWIFAGDVTRENGRIKLTRAVWVFRWEGVGFDGVLENPTNSKVTLRKLKNVVDIPEEAEIFSVPVADSWGM